MRIALLVLAALAAAAYAGYWFVVATGVEDGAERWIAEARARGETVEIGKMDVGGFPLAVRLAVDDLRYRWSDPDFAGEWTGGGFRAAMGLDGARQIDIAFEGAQELRIDGDNGTGPVVVTWPAEATASVEADGEGRPARAAFDSPALTVDHPAAGERVESGPMSLAARRVAAADGAPPALAVDTTVERLTLPQSAEALLGPVIDRIELAADMTHPPAWDGPPFDPVAWRDAGGALLVREARIVWAGVEGRLSGRLALDAQLQPAGDLEVSIKGYEEVLSAAVADGQVAKDDAETLRAVLDLFARTDAEGNRTVTAPVVVKNGGVHVGPMLLAKLPPIDWEALLQP